MLEGERGIDGNNKIWRIDEPTIFLMKELGINYQLGDRISEGDIKTISRAYANALIEVMRGPATTRIAKGLMMTSDIDLSTPVQKYSFSGGVGEHIYENGQISNHYDDIGSHLAQEILQLTKTYNMPLIEPENKIRATVIGAGSFSLSVSGSTCFVNKTMKLPINNVPVLSVHVSMDNLGLDTIIEGIQDAFTRFDMIEGEDVIGLYFPELFIPRSDLLDIFAKAFEQALPNSVKNNIPIILLFRSDLAKLLGLYITRNTSIRQNLICLDELQLESGDFIDIGASLKETHVYPITIKSLVFNRSRPSPDQ